MIKNKKSMHLEYVKDKNLLSVSLKLSFLKINTEIIFTVILSNYILHYIYLEKNETISFYKYRQ